MNLHVIYFFHVDCLKRSPKCLRLLGQIDLIVDQIIIVIRAIQAIITWTFLRQVTRRCFLPRRHLGRNCHLLASPFTFFSSAFSLAILPLRSKLRPNLIFRLFQKIQRSRKELDRILLICVKMHDIYEIRNPKTTYLNPLAGVHRPCTLSKMRFLLLSQHFSVILYF